ncbi:hypothetical protein DL762_006892 [Monosporascus cannonballus]|uniref:Uncharacterized protein n=1 Tax=Monosporascus cannonballus TaxID=155416 RepID=A0ABY0H552_9PEZI|nr:hypothetical protein DL762_006892 [Monosporascus cannonballus]
MSLAPPASIQDSQERISVPAIGDRHHSETGDSTPTIREPHEKDGGTDVAKTDPKSKNLRSLFSFGKKKAEEKTATKTPPRADTGLPSPPPTQSISQASTRRSATGSPINIGSPRKAPSSPGRGNFSTSPRVGSPAGSQIFERDVQESTAMPNSPAIPSHIQTENYIPPVLDASSEAITDDHLDPDSVEIVTHTSHQPAAVAVTGAAPHDSSAASWTDDLAAFTDKEESASNYGSLDSADVRRLSFISFADVVQAEHGPPAGSRDSVHLAGLTSLSSLSANRSPSPIRSPVSSPGAETSPPNSKSGSIKGLNMSPGRKPLGSPTATEHSLLTSGDLNIETMSQALRRTGSTDLRVHRSLPISPIEGPSR